MEPNLKSLPITVYIPEDNNNNQNNENNENNETNANNNENSEGDKEKPSGNMPRVYTFDVPVVVYNENCALNK